MGYEKLSDLLKAKHPGVGMDRIAVRTQGCWNCIHWNQEKAVDLWWKEARNKLLARAVQLATESPMGEETPAVRNIREQIPLLDVKVEAGEFGMCSRGKQPDGTPVGDFVMSMFLCEQWTGKEGASVAREGQGPDKLPGELMERLHEKKVE